METPSQTKTKILVTGAGGFLGKYVVDAISRSDRTATAVTLGRAPENDIVVDLHENGPELNERFESVIHCAGGCFEGNMRSLNVELTAGLLKLLEKNPPKAFVYISSVEVYGRREGSELTEGTIPDPDTPAGTAKLETERMLTEWCGKHGTTLSILRCPPIVGTGMKGPLRKLVNSIYRGSYQHIGGNEARMSVVHAVDVAYAAIAIAPIGGIYNLTDGDNPTRHDFAEALSYRMGHKRIFTVTDKRARRWARISDWLPFASFGSRELQRETTTLTFNSDKIFDALNWRPNRVTEYLTTHDYEQDSI